MVGPFGYSIGPRTSYVCGCATHAVRCTLWWVVVCVRGRVVGTRASRRHASRAAAHDQVRSACSRAVPTNVFQARNKSIYGARRSRTVIRAIGIAAPARHARRDCTLCSGVMHMPDGAQNARLRPRSPLPPPGIFMLSPRLVPFAFPSAGSPSTPAHTAPCTRPHPVYSSLHADLHVWRSV